MSRRGGANHYDPRRDPRRYQLSPETSQQSSVNAARSGRGRGANHPDSQPSPPISQQSSINAALSGHGRGRGSRGGHTVPSSTPTPVTVTASSSTSAPVIYHPSVVAPVVAGSSSVSTVPSPSLPPVTVSTEMLSSELEKTLTLETVPEASAPSSQKAIRFPDRPGFGQVGRRIRVRANHFHVQVAADKVFHHYDVCIFNSLIFITNY